MKRYLRLVFVMIFLVLSLCVCAARPTDYAVAKPETTIATSDNIQIGNMWWIKLSDSELKSTGDMFGDQSERTLLMMQKVQEWQDAHKDLRVVDFEFLVPGADHNHDYQGIVLLSEPIKK